MKVAYAVLWADGRSVILAHCESHMLDDNGEYWTDRCLAVRSAAVAGAQEREDCRRYRSDSWICSRPKSFGNGVKGEAMSACPSVESPRATEGPFTEIV
jgi:hypothetical protein